MLGALRDGNPSAQQVVGLLFHLAPGFLSDVVWQGCSGGATRQSIHGPRCSTDHHRPQTAAPLLDSTLPNRPPPGQDEPQAATDPRRQQILDWICTGKLVIQDDYTKRTSNRSAPIHDDCGAESSQDTSSTRQPVHHPSRTGWLVLTTTLSY